MKYLLATWILTASLSAQVVRVANLGTTPFVGWKRTTIDLLPAALQGRVGAVDYVVGRRVGEDTHVVDVRVSLAPGQELAIDLAQGVPSPWTLGAFPANAATFFGGLPMVDGHLLQLVSLVPDGAGYSVQMRVRTAPLVNVDLWLTWYPDQPGFCEGEVAITASNPAIPDLVVQVPGPFPLTFGNAIVLPLGGVPWSLLPNGMHLCDGQGRILPVTFAWPSLFTAESDLGSLIAVADRQIGAVGIRQLLVDGNPEYPPGYSGRAWMQAHWADAVVRLHDFQGPVCGPYINSSVAGRQEDQTFVRGEALLPDGVGAERVAYLSALKLAARPVHHLETDGSPLDLALHVSPRLVLWDGRVHWSAVLSPDRLGKTGNITLTDSKQWWGPDVEHWLMNTLAAATRLTGSPACQWLLSAQAKIYQLQSTTGAGMSTSSPFAARAVGWEGILAVHLWRELEDRALASQVRAHWQNRVTNVILPAYGSAPGDVWDPRFDDLRLGKGWWYLPWQQAVGAYGLDLGCAVLGPAAGRQVALAAALRAMRDAWAFEGGVWRGRSAVALDGRHQDSPVFHLFGSPLAPAVVLRHLPNHIAARTIWDQLHTDATGPEHFAWFAPGVP